LPQAETAIAVEVMASSHKTADNVPRQ